MQVFKIGLLKVWTWQKGTRTGLSFPSLSSAFLLIQLLNCLQFSNVLCSLIILYLCIAFCSLVFGIPLLVCGPGNFLSFKTQLKYLCEVFLNFLVSQVLPLFCLRFLFVFSPSVCLCVSVSPKSLLHCTIYLLTCCCCTLVSFINMRIMSYLFCKSQCLVSWFTHWTTQRMFINK